MLSPGARLLSVRTPGVATSFRRPLPGAGTADAEVDVATSVAPTASRVVATVNPAAAPSRPRMRMALLPLDARLGAGGCRGFTGRLRPPSPKDDQRREDGEAGETDRRAECGEDRTAPWQAGNNDPHCRNQVGTSIRRPVVISL